MSTKNRLIIAAALLAIASSVTAVQAQTVRYPNGRIIDSHGWRYYNGNWDSTCLNVPWLSNSAACSR